MADEIGEETARPPNSTLQERKPHLRKSPSHAAEKERFADCIGRGCKMTDMVIDVVRNRGAAAPSFTMAVKARHYLKRLAPGPHRIVIVFAVDAESVEPEG